MARYYPADWVVDIAMVCSDISSMLHLCNLLDAV